MAAIGFRNRLLGNRLSVLAEACQVIFLLRIWFFDGRSLGGEIVIVCVGIENCRRKAVSQCTVHGWVGTLRQRQVSSRFAFHGGNGWATR